MTARELQTCTFQGPCASNTTKIPREDTQRDTERTKRWREERARNFGPPFGAPPFGAPPFGAPPFGAPLFLGLGSPPFGALPFEAPPFGAGLAKVGQLRLAKVGLAKVGLAKVGLAKVGLSRHPMVRKGWTHVEVPNGWVQLIRGPRPKSVQWPRAHDRKHQQPQRHIGGQRQATEVPKKDSRQVGVGQAPLHPDERIARARVRVGQLESALKALDPLDPAATSLQEALKKAQFQARVPPIESRVKVAEEYLARKQKRLLEAEDAVVAAIEGRDRLKAEVAEGERSLAKIQEEKLRLQEHPGSVPMDISPARQSNLMVELEQLQMQVAQLQAQNEELMSSPKRQAVGSGAAPDRGSRLREDFVPACDEDVVRWMRWTCRMQQQLGMPTSWRDCAKLWRVQRGVCHRYQIRQWSRTLSGVIEEVHRQCDRTALCTGEISVRIARSPSGGGFEPGSQEERGAVV